MSTVARVFLWLLVLLILVPVVMLLVTNRHDVPMYLNPFDRADPFFTVSGRLFFHWVAAFSLGALVGYLVAWGYASRYRRRARAERYEATRWRIRAERAHENQAPAAAREPDYSAPALAPPRRA